MTGRTLSPKQPGLWGRPNHPILKTEAGVGSASDLHGLHRTDRSLSLFLLSPRTQESREWLKRVSCVSHSTPERCTLRDLERKCVRHTEKGERHGERDRKREKEREMGKQGEAGRGHREGVQGGGVGWNLLLTPSDRSLWPAIRTAGGRWPWTDNGSEECGTWD